MILDEAKQFHLVDVSVVFLGSCASNVHGTCNEAIDGVAVLEDEVGDDVAEVVPVLEEHFARDRM